LQRIGEFERWNPACELVEFIAELRRIIPLEKEAFAA
jgi:hypothetical protein